MFKKNKGELVMRCCHTTNEKKRNKKKDVKILTAGEGVQQRGVRGGSGRRTVILLFGFADLGVALGKFEPNRLRNVRIEPHALYFYRSCC